MQKNKETGISFLNSKENKSPSLSPGRMKAEELAFIHILLSFSGELQVNAF